MREVSLKEILDKMDPSVHQQILDGVKVQQATHVVLFENVDMSSSRIGERTVVFVGPKNTYKTPEECEGKWLNDLPSQRQYPQEYARV